MEKIFELDLEEDNLTSSQPNSKFELVGLKYLDEIALHQAKIITPYTVGAKGWEKSLEVITKRYKTEGWIIMAVRKLGAYEEIFGLIGKTVMLFLYIVLDKLTVGYNFSDINEQFDLNILVTTNVQNSFQWMSTFFKDSEIFSGAESALLKVSFFNKFLNTILSIFSLKNIFPLNTRQVLLSTELLPPLLPY